jgi:hypothetical protein
MHRRPSPADRLAGLIEAMKEWPQWPLEADTPVILLEALDELRRCEERIVGLLAANSDLVEQRRQAANLAVERKIMLDALLLERLPLPNAGPQPPRGCVCPPGAERSCSGLGCPRRNATGLSPFRALSLSVDDAKVHVTPGGQHDPTS